jgi:hypothetical protein
MSILSYTSERAISILTPIRSSGIVTASPVASDTAREDKRLSSSNRAVRSTSARKSHYTPGRDREKGNLYLQFRLLSVVMVLPVMAILRRPPHAAQLVRLASARVPDIRISPGHEAV